MERGLGPAGREKFDFSSQFSFENVEFTDKWQKVLEWTPLTLDEPNRPAGNRGWHRPENQALAEWVQTRAYEHRPAFFPLPHEHLLDNAIVMVCTSEITLSRRGYAEVLEFDPDLLNRAGKRRTPKRGTLSFRKPHPENWLEYMNARIAYNQKRAEVLRSKMMMADKKADLVPALTHEEAVQIIMSNPSDFQVNGEWNAIRTANLIPGFSQYAAQRAVDDVKRLLSMRDKAERMA